MSDHGIQMCQAVYHSTNLYVLLDPESLFNLFRFPRTLSHLLPTLLQHVVIAACSMIAMRVKTLQSICLIVIRRYWSILGQESIQPLDMSALPLVLWVSF